MTFNNLCEKYSIWIIKYNSNNLNNPVYLIWYSDSNDNDKLLTYETGEIFVCISLRNIITNLSKNIHRLTNSEKLKSWIEKSFDIEISESHIYDLKETVKCVLKNKIDDLILENIVDFINLIEDFINQDSKNGKIRKYTESTVLRNVWEFYYENIFWKNENKDQKLKNINKPKLEINNIELSNKLEELIDIFENNLRFIS